MDILTESILRSKCPCGSCDYPYDPGTFVTETARQYAAERGIRLVERAWEAMSWTKPPEGAQSGGKPETMTHLRAGELVPKMDPRIRFRGKMDSFQAELLCRMASAVAAGNQRLASDLSEVLMLCRSILGSEVKQTPLPEWTLFGMGPEEIHRASHTPPHVIPDVRMGETAVSLNRLRALSRELELSWLEAYPESERPDIVLALNRLSSALYILFRKEVKTI
ncbi:MAG: hypothetical protein VB034_07015 [Eubacteriales bacterium]|nr:hypothetical protein [Eubacteriales bacterium]